MLTKHAKLLTVGLPVLLVFIWASFPAAGREQIAVTGTIYASVWNANDQALVVVIVTDEGDEYTVSEADHGRELMKFEAHSVKAIGKISMDRRGKKVITVNRFVIED
jgi:hypothetical protein